MTDLNWRYATKTFDANKKISDASLDSIIDAVRLSPSSFGLQPYKILVVSDSETKMKLKDASFGQSQVVDCSHIIVFCVESGLTDEHVKEYITRIADTRQIDKTHLEVSQNIIAGFINKMSPKDRIEWAKRQAYLGLGFMLYSCAELQIDSCPMEGFLPDKYDSILNLSEKGLTSAVVATLGYRSDTDKNQFAVKVRKSIDSFREDI